MKDRYIMFELRNEAFGDCNERCSSSHERKALKKLGLNGFITNSHKGRYTRGSLLPQDALATRSRSKAPSSAPTISREKMCCATKLLLPSFAPSYQTGLI